MTKKKQIKEVKAELQTRHFRKWTLGFFTLQPFYMYKNVTQDKAKTQKARYDH